MADVSITLLGGFSAAVDGEPVADGAWRLRKARDLVKLLALAPGGRLHREQVMDVLWRDRPPAAAANNLYQAVHAARRALGPATIGVHDELLSLAAEVDVVRLEAAAEAARHARTRGAYRAALSLYGGELLPENRYDDWATDRREALAELHTALVHELDALGPAQRLTGLPADASSFVGRERELGELRSLLARTRVLTLTGTGGTGKTRLALELARGAESGFADGAALVELALVAEPERVPDAVAAALDVRALPGRTLLDAAADYLGPRAVLLVVDNCEHVLGASVSVVDALLRAAPRLTVVATTREPLRVPGEIVFRVPSLGIPDPERVPPPADLLRYESVRLYVERAEAAAPGFALDDENAADVARICFRLDGLPLALELAAARTGALGPASIAERLDDRFRLLGTGSRAAPTRQQTLAATLQWSYDLLVPPERVLFRRLAVFAGGFDLGAVESVCGGDEVDVRDAAHLLARLAEQSLVIVDGHDRERRYRLLETVRLYAREKLEEAGETEALRERHARWALDLAERSGESPSLDLDAASLRIALDALLRRDPEGALRLCLALWPFWLRRIDLGEANRRFTAALAAGPERTELRADALLAAAKLDVRGGELARGRARAEESLADAIELGLPRAEWSALQFLGGYGLTYATGPAVATGVEWFARGLEVARRAGFAAEEALGVYSLGVAHWLAGRPDADELLGRGLDLMRGLEGSPARIPSPINIGELRIGRDRGRLHVILVETLQPFLAVSCAQAIPHVLANLAAAAWAHGDVDRARVLLDEAAARCSASGDERGRAHVLVRQAFLVREHAPAAARARLEGALELRRRLNDRRGLGLALTALGLVETDAGDRAAAARHLAEARDLFRRAGDRWGYANSLWGTADLALSEHDFDGAEAAMAEARAVLDEPQLERWIAHSVVGLAEIALARGNAARAAALFAEAAGRYATAVDGAGVAAVSRRLAAL